jgi:hypothetical protein
VAIGPGSGKWSDSDGKHQASNGVFKPAIASKLDFQFELVYRSEKIHSYGPSVRSAAVNHVDETSWQQAGAINWLWTMTNCLAAFFMVHSTQSEKGNRWVERLLPFRQTCRLRAQATFPLLVNIVKAYFKEQTPNLG